MLSNPNLFEPVVNMWVYDEYVDVVVDDDEKKENKQLLSKIINVRHENIKYLPGIKLPTNIRAIPDLGEASEGATLLVFVVPHQFLGKLLPTIKRQMSSSAYYTRGVSLIKGMDFDSTTNSPVLISQTISKALSIDVGVLMGANVANDVAAGYMCESTLACRFDFSANSGGGGGSGGGEDWNERTRLVFDSPDTHFHVQHITDVAGAELCGTIKNVIALGAGIVDGLGEGGSSSSSSSSSSLSNTKAALLRVGLVEMKKFGRVFFDVHEDKTFWESCGVADLITTSYGGRNRKCAEEWTKRRRRNRSRMSRSRYNNDKSSSSSNSCQELWNQVEKELLNGQKLQGTLATKECYEALNAKNLLQEFPLITKIYQIAFDGHDVSTIIDGIVVRVANSTTGAAAPSIRSRL